MKTDYETKADEFCARHGVKFSVAFESSNCPPFCDGKHIHGDCYRVNISRNGRRISFRFWNSYNDKQNGNEPSVYDVLACASSDLHCPENFHDFCAEFGYDEDSRKAEKTHKLCLAQSEKLNRIFDDEIIQAELSTIN